MYVQGVYPFPYSIIYFDSGIVAGCCELEVLPLEDFDPLMLNFLPILVTRLGLRSAAAGEAAKSVEVV